MLRQHKTSLPGGNSAKERRRARPTITGFEMMGMGHAWSMIQDWFVPFLERASRRASQLSPVLPEQIQATLRFLVHRRRTIGAAVVRAHAPVQASRRSVADSHARIIIMRRTHTSSSARECLRACPQTLPTARCTKWISGAMECPRLYQARELPSWP